MVQAISNGDGALQEAIGPLVAENGGALQVEVVLSGITPMLHNAMSEQQLLDIRDKVKKAKSAARPKPREEADSKVYQLADGRPHLPVKNLYACLISAGQFVRLDGKRQISTAKATILPGMLTIESTVLPLVTADGQPAPWEVDIQKGTNPNGGEAVCIIRPRFDDWHVTVTLEIDQEQMPESMARALVDIAGKRIGLGDARPQRRGTFGRFVVSSWSPVREE